MVLRCIRNNDQSFSDPGTQLRFLQLSRSPLLTQAEEDYMVDQFTKSGFKMSLQFYQHGVIPFLVTLQDEIPDTYSISFYLQNRYLSWQVAHDSGAFAVTVPSLAIYPGKVQPPGLLSV